MVWKPHVTVAAIIEQENRFLFSDGNAASKKTQFYDSLNDLDKIPWDVLNGKYWGDFPDGKRKRCAEVLVYPRIDPQFITSIHVCCELLLSQLIEKHPNVKLSKHLFF